eukprot:UN03606
MRVCSILDKAKKKGYDLKEIDSLLLSQEISIIQILMEKTTNKDCRHLRQWIRSRTFKFMTIPQTLLSYTVPLEYTSLLIEENIYHPAMNGIAKAFEDWSKSSLQQKLYLLYVVCELSIRNKSPV